MFLSLLFFFVLVKAVSSVQVGGKDKKQCDGDNDSEVAVCLSLIH
jgi:hypothetical protein